MFQLLGVVVLAGMTCLQAQAHTQEQSPRRNLAAASKIMTEASRQLRSVRAGSENSVVHKPTTQSHKQFRDPPVGHLTKINSHHFGMKGLTFEYGGGSSSGGSHYGY